MDNLNKQALYNQLLSMRAAIDAALSLLAEQGGDCPHPPNRRENLTTMGGPEHWMCKDCGFEYKEGS